MNRIQRYIFYRVLRSVVIIVGGLALLGILVQGLSRTDIIVENRQSTLTYLQIVALGAPQIIALLTPIAIFVAAITSLNRMHRDSEIVVSSAAGMTQMDIAKPVILLAACAAIVHLGINTLVQPAAQRTLRETVYTARSDLASSLIRPGQYTRPNEKLAVFAREVNGNEIFGVQISERPRAANSLDYFARSGRFLEVDGVPGIELQDGEIHRLDEDGVLNILKFDQSTLDLSPFVQTPEAVFLKASDRYLGELFVIDETNPRELANQDKFFSEAHARLTTPISSITLVLLAFAAVLGGNFNRRGYGRRIFIASSLALVFIILQLVAQSLSASNRPLNLLQWAIPISGIVILSVLLFYPRLIPSFELGRAQWLDTGYRRIQKDGTIAFQVVASYTGKASRFVTTKYQSGRSGVTAALGKFQTDIWPAVKTRSLSFLKSSQSVITTRAQQVYRTFRKWSQSALTTLAGVSHIALDKLNAREWLPFIKSRLSVYSQALVRFIKR